MGAGASSSTSFDERQDSRVRQTRNNGYASPSAPVVEQEAAPVPTPRRSVQHYTETRPREFQSDLHISTSQNRSNETREDVFGVPHHDEYYQDPVPESSENVFSIENFFHENGEVYSVLYNPLTDERQFIDFKSQSPKPFPDEWYTRGTLIDEKGVIVNKQSAPKPSTQFTASLAATDDREGHLDHPDRGQLYTYLFEESHFVHYYYEPGNGTWLRMPLGWELQHTTVKPMIARIEQRVPEWRDRGEMMAMLRTCNYDLDECIVNYHAIDDHIPLGSSTRITDTFEKDRLLRTARNESERLRQELAKARMAADAERKHREEAEAKAAKATERVSKMQVELYNVQLQLETLQLSQQRAASSPDVDQVSNLRSYVRLNETAKQLHLDYIQLKSMFSDVQSQMGAQFKELMGSAKQMRSGGSASREELDELRALYMREVVQRKLLYNKLLELRGNIRVFCRCRRDDRVECSVNFPTPEDVSLSQVNPNGQLSKRMFSFDRVFGINATQEEVFEETKPVITSCADGYNVCIMAYGQTGSGKTFTMMGPPTDPGVNIRSLQELLKVCDERSNVDYRLRISIVEIYNETVMDLLSPEASVVELHAQGNHVHLTGVREMAVRSLPDIRNIMEMGDRNRHVASTKMNSTSSRSHLVLMLTVEGRDLTSGTVSTGRLMLCDLAGSERVGRSGAEGQRLLEAASINKSLSALGQVFSALRSKQLHVPFRNSKLTHILQPALSGDAKACLFANISPDRANINESLSTLQFASGCRQVALGQAKKNVRKLPLDDAGGP